MSILGIAIRRQQLSICLLVHNKISVWKVLPLSGNLENFDQLKEEIHLQMDNHAQLWGNVEKVHIEWMSPLNKQVHYIMTVLKDYFNDQKITTRLFRTLSHGSTYRERKQYSSGEKYLKDENEWRPWFNSLTQKDKDDLVDSLILAKDI